MKAAEIKRFFKNLGIPVRVRTVAVKYPFAQIWIQSDDTGIHGPLRYSYEFPVALRQKLLRIIYGEDFAERQAAVGCSDSSAGNVRAHSLSVSGEEWEKLIA